MPLLIKGLTGEDLEFLHDSCRTIFLDGACYEFAAALSRGLRWPMYALKTAEHPIRHVLALDPEGGLWDVRGKLSDEELGKPFGVRPHYDFHEVRLEDLRKVRPVSETGINTALRQAQALWPNLPWLPHTSLSRAKTFLTDLEALCREHGVWLRGQVPASWIHLSETLGDEEGYTLSPTADGMGLVIQRRVKTLGEG